MANVIFIKLVWVVFLFSAILLNYFVYSGKCVCKVENSYYDCTNHNIDVIEPTNETCTTTANYSSNTVTTFDEDILKWYVHIDLSHNKIENLDINIGFEKTKTLNVSYNQIEKLFIHQMINLEVLDLSHNNKEIQLVKLPKNLKSFYISNTEIKSYENISECKNLKYFIASNCKLKRESMYIEAKNESLFTNMMNLEKLDLSSNLIEEISHEMLTGLQSLTQLDLSNNKIRTFDLPLEDLRSLKCLDLSKNYLKAVPHFQLGQRITKVNLSYNPIDNLDVEVLKNITGNGTVNCEIDIRGLNKAISSKFLQNIKISRYEENINVTKNSNCSCAHVLFGSTNLTLCVQEASETCWVDEAMATTTQTPTTSTTQSTIEVTTGTSVVNTTETIPETKAMNDSSPMSHASYFLESLGPAKLSFLAFLLFTLVILIIINCIVGDPVVDDNWWEEKHPGDRPIT